MGRVREPIKVSRDSDQMPQAETDRVRLRREARDYLAVGHRLRRARCGLYRLGKLMTALIGRRELSLSFTIGTTAATPVRSRASGLLDGWAEPSERDRGIRIVVGLHGVQSARQVDGTGH